jgi:hypothetical protein
MSYSGWSNYETWCVNLWLDNERGSYEAKRDIIGRADDPHSAADELKDWVEEMAPDLRESVWSDLLSAAFSKVDWKEIVEADWDDLHEEEEEEEDPEAETEDEETPSES